MYLTAEADLVTQVVHGNFGAYSFFHSLFEMTIHDAGNKL
jgi:hypothetical protein